MNGTSLTDANGTARPQIGASSFRALQERLWAVRSRPAPARKAEAGAGEEAPAAQPAPADEAGQEPSGAVAEASETSSAEPSEQYLAGGEAAPEGLPSATEAGDDILRPLVAKFSGTAALLKKIEPEIDPFSATSAEDPFAPGLADPQSGDVARSLLDVMSAPPGSSQPQERSLAADTLLRLVPRLPLKSLANLVERVSRMEAPPQLLVRRLIRDARSEIAGPLLERASAISDQDLMVAISEGDAAKQRLIARRRTISPALSDALIEAGDAGALLTLVRNPGATFSIESFHRLGGLAAEMPALQAPLSTRLDTPAPVAFELFWALPAELRRYVLSRFLTDSETLDRVLKIALSVRNSESAEAGASEPKFPDKAKIDEFVELARGNDRSAAAARLAELAAISPANADRIMADHEGEPLSVVFKVIGLNRSRFAEVIDEFRQSPQGLLRGSRNISELQSIFDSLSFNKARMLLTYWDWAVQHSGPYARNGK